jgi:hypothetical protein
MIVIQTRMSSTLALDVVGETQSGPQLALMIASFLSDV